MIYQKLKQYILFSEHDTAAYLQTIILSFCEDLFEMFCPNLYTLQYFGRRLHCYKCSNSNFSRLICFLLKSSQWIEAKVYHSVEWAVKIENKNFRFPSVVTIQ